MKMLYFQLHWIDLIPLAFIVVALITFYYEKKIIKIDSLNSPKGKNQLEIGNNLKKKKYKIFLLIIPIVFQLLTFTTYKIDQVNKEYEIVKDSLMREKESKLKDSFAIVSHNQLIEFMTQFDSTKSENYKQYFYLLFKKDFKTKKTLKERIEEKYPYGFVAYCDFGNHFFPFFSKIVDLNADWKNVKIDLNPPNSVKITLPKISIKRSSEFYSGHESFGQTWVLIPYIRGKGIICTVSKFDKEPNLYFEHLDSGYTDKGREIYVLGMKMYEPTDNIEPIQSGLSGAGEIFYDKK
jgi:hypothetical protein